MAKLTIREKTLLLARLEQLKKEATSLKRESKAVTEYGPKLKKLEVKKPKDIEILEAKVKLANINNDISREMLEKERESNNIETLIGAEKKEEFDVKEMKALIISKGLKARAHEILVNVLPVEKTSCYVCSTSCVACTTCVAMSTGTVIILL